MSILRIQLNVRQGIDEMKFTVEEVETWLECWLIKNDLTKRNTINKKMWGVIVDWIIPRYKEFMSEEPLKELNQLRTNFNELTDDYNILELDFREYKRTHP